MKRIIIALSAAALAASGCSAPADDAEEKVDVANSALGEAACATDTISSPNGGTASYTFHDFALVTSPNGSYTNSSCANEFIAEISIPSMSTDGVYVWNTVTPTCTAGIFRYMGLALYKHTSSGWSAATTAQYVADTPDGGSCEWQLQSGGIPDFNVGGTSGIDKVRIASYIEWFKLFPSSSGYEITSPSLTSTMIPR